MLFAIFSIKSDALNLFVNLLFLFLVVVWFALIYWTYMDARRRIEDPVLIACAVVASCFPYLGTVVYTILRPPEYLEDAHERELEIRAAEMRVRQLREQSCPHCEFPVDKSYMRCPNCQRRLKDPCSSCGKPLDPRWTMCPYCETEVPGRERRPRQAARTGSRRSEQRRPVTRPRKDAPSGNRQSGDQRARDKAVARGGDGQGKPTRSGEQPARQTGISREDR